MGPTGGDRTDAATVTMSSRLLLFVSWLEAVDAHDASRSPRAAQSGRAAAAEAEDGDEGVAAQAQARLDTLSGQHHATSHLNDATGLRAGQMAVAGV